MYLCVAYCVGFWNRTQVEVKMWRKLTVC